MHESIAVIGGKGTGKTSFVLNLAQQAYNLASQKFLMVCNSDPEVLSALMRIDNPQKLAAWKNGGIVKYYDRTVGNPFKMLNNLQELCLKKEFGNGGIFLDDCTTYIRPNPDDSVRALLVEHRHFGLDLYFGTHQLSFLPKIARGMISTLVIFKTGDTFYNAAQVRSLGYPNHEAIYNAWCRVMQHPDKHYCETIRTGV